MAQQETRIDPVTIIGLGLILLPLMTMWHEIGGHAATCVALGGKLVSIGAFYVECESASLLSRRLVACAGVTVDTVLALIAWQLWRRATGDLARLVLFYVMIGKGFVAAGYFLFSGFSGVGDLGPTPGGGLEGLSPPWLWRVLFIAIGGFVYFRLVKAAIPALNAMLGDTEETKVARRRIAHIFYLTLGFDAVLVGLLNPIGIFITIMSAAASSFGGNAGFISMGYAVQRGSIARSFTIERNWIVFVIGVVVSLGFAVILGPTIRFR
ncbi:MAG: hypothetical protein ABI810_01485 [Sphingomonas bacterium]